MRLLVISILFLALWSCSDKKKPVVGESEFQIRLNSEFKDASITPLTKKDLANFDGLDFFSIDSNFIVKASLVRTPNSDWFNMKTSTDRTSEERVYGILNFELNDRPFKLNVYQGKESIETEGQEDYLFLPFLDDTNGETTYGGGRYIDLKIPDGTSIIIDFNKAYSPYCAYNENYSCPIVPRQNYLPIKITAGVKAWKK